MSTKFFIYTRKSTDDGTRQVRSIADQLSEARELARREGLVIVDTFVEKQTAKKPGRPVFNEMMDRLEKGEAAGIIAWHPDRLARNSLDGGRIIWFVDTATILELKFPSYRFDPTPQGKLSLAIEFGISKYYVDKLSEDIKRGIRRKVHDGIWPQFAPLGYVNDHKSKTIVVDPEKAPLVRKAFEMYATGNYTLRQVRTAVNDLGLTGKRAGLLAVSNYQYMLQNPVYYGVLRYHGEYFAGRHEPLISKELFDRVQRAMSAKSKPKSNTLKTYLYRGLFRCGECGRLITTETQKGHNYLRCTKWEVKCSQPYVREDRIADQVTKTLRRFALPPDWADWMLGQTDAEDVEQKQVAQSKLEGLTKKIQDVTERLDRLMTAYTESVLSLAEYRESKNKLMGEKWLLEELKAELERSAATAFEPLKEFILATKQAGILAEEGTDEERRDFLKNASSNLTISNRELSVNPRDAWKLVVDQGSFAQHNAAPPHGSAALIGENRDGLQKRRV